jgi:hypothetical protein
MGSAPRYLSIRPSFTALPPAPGQSHPFDHAPVASGLPRKADKFRASRHSQKFQYLKSTFNSAGWLCQCAKQQGCPKGLNSFCLGFGVFC